MGTSYENITSYYSERMQRIAIFDPLYVLQSKRGKDKSGKPIDYFGLGLLTLLFFFENMLVRNKKAGARELAFFIRNMNRGELEIDDGDYEKIAREIIQVFRPPSGVKNSKTFYNWDQRKEETIYYSILKASEFDSDTNAQYYVLDDQGLELVFATKEYFTEFQLSINQLVLRKQLEKGEFASALRQIDEMRMDVQGIQDRIYRIRHEILRNIISDETYRRYREVVEDIYRRLGRENEEFDELESFVKETRNRLGSDMQNESDIKTYQMIIQIESQLSSVHGSHRKLLEESIMLKTTALESAQESLYYVGIDSFNFKEQITGSLVAKPLPLEASNLLVKPFLFLEKKKMWSPLSVFEPQRIEKDRREMEPESFLKAMSREEETREIESRQEAFREIMELIRKAMGESQDITLEEVVENLRGSDDAGVLDKRDFYDFWIILHQKSPIDIKIEEKSKDLFAKAIEAAGENEGQIQVVEQRGIVRCTPKYTMKNMRFKIGGGPNDQLYTGTDNASI